MQNIHSHHIKVGTRGSKLAKAQTEIIISKLRALFPAVTFETIAITVSGEVLKDRPLAEIGGAGVFVKELEDALLRHEVDFVVHSLKDLPTAMPPDLVLACVANREDPRDVLVSRNNLRFDQLPASSRVATSSRRRAAQLKALRKDLVFVDIRGNVDTRLRKLTEGQCDAIVLAAAGLKRLDLIDQVSQFFDSDICLPAVGQGVLAAECRVDDKETLAMLKAIDDPKVRSEITAERAFLERLGGGCSVPVGALAQVDLDPTISDQSARLAGGTPALQAALHLSACVAALDGSKIIRHEMSGSTTEAEQIGHRLAEWMLANGAQPILQALRASTPNDISPP